MQMYTYINILTLYQLFLSILNHVDLLHSTIQKSRLFVNRKCLFYRDILGNMKDKVGKITEKVFSR